MPFTLPTSISTGDVLTASNYNQAVRSNAMFGMATFTNEAARDAALTSPEEGMMAYLTAPTVPAASGDTTAVPTGITTIYNGTVWVCVTPVSSRTDASGTTTSGTYTASLTGSPGTNPAVTIATGASALITMSLDSSTSTGFAGMSVAVSGATTVAASDNYIVSSSSTSSITLTRSFVLTGLIGGTNTFTLNYRTSGTGTYSRRNLTVVGIA